MSNLNNWDWVLLAIGCFIAIVSLARLMLSHRNKLLARLRAEMEQQRAKKQRAEQQKKQQAALDKQRQQGRGTAA